MTSVISTEGAGIGWFDGMHPTCRLILSTTLRKHPIYNWFERYHRGEDSAISNVLCYRSEFETEDVAKSFSYERRATSTLNAFLCLCPVLV